MYNEKDIDYIEIETYRNFSNGIKQCRLKFPYGVQWSYTNGEYWTIVPKEFYGETEWAGPIDHEYMFDKWVVCIIRDIDPRPYFEEFGITPREMMETVGLEHRVFAFIKDSSQLGGLVRFGKMETFVGPATYIQLLSHGVVNDPQYGVYNVPNARPTQLDTFGHGKWVEVRSDRAYEIWSDLYGWVLDKLVFIDRPCPVMLDCNDAFEVWQESFQATPNTTKFSIDELDSTIMEVMLNQIKTFTNQFVETGTIKKLQDEFVNPDYENDYIDNEY